MTNDDIRRLASPVVVETDDAIRSIYAQLDGLPLDVVSVIYRMLLMGACGALIRAGQSNKVIATNLRAYADMLEREST